MKKYGIKEILNYAKENSSFYKNQLFNSKLDSLIDVPIINQDDFWQANVLTSMKPSGLVFKSGGSSGAPKYSYFTYEEWTTFTKCFGLGISKGILQNDDRVANLFYVGDLYASFLFIKDSLQWIDPKILSFTQFPIAGNTDLNNILKSIEEFNINVICGVPSQILKLLECFDSDRDNFKKINIEKILFGGESLYKDQEDSIKRLFPNITISSIGYASVDGGLLGYSSKDCKNGEHRMFDGATIIEIVDIDTNELITEKNKIGKVILTNLTRKLMPIIRYPAGDLAMWIEDVNSIDRKFKLCGRSEEGARLGTITVYFEDTRKLITKVLSSYTGIQFQMILDHFDNKDSLTFKIAGKDLTSSPQILNSLLKEFKNEKKVYDDILSKKLIHPLKIEIVRLDQLESNQRTGKLKRVIDKRF